MTIHKQKIATLLGATLDQTEKGPFRDILGKVDRKYIGKVRDNYVVGDKRLIVVTDRISAFDKILGTIPYKGAVLNQLAAHWFDITKHIAPSHFISLPDPNAMWVHNCTPLTTEFVMRSYLTGSTSTSIWRAYERGDREFCGHRIADGMVRNEPLPAPLLTPSTKAAKGGHDVSVSKDGLIAMGHISAEDFEQAEAMVTKLFAFGQAHAAKQGLILVDTKYELGRKADGTLVVIDEMHTPDSSRYWYADDYEARMKNGQEPRSLDKEYVRRWMVDEHGYRGDGPPPALSSEVRVEAALRYIENYEVVTGKAFVVAGDIAAGALPIERLIQNVGPLLGDSSK